MKKLFTLILSTMLLLGGCRSGNPKGPASGSPTPSTGPTTSQAATEMDRPRFVMSSTYADWSGIIRKSEYDQWEYVRTNLDGWLLHINRIGRTHKACLSDADFRGMIAVMKDSEIELHVETKSYYADDAHGTDIQNIGRYDAERDISFLQRVYEEGFSVAELNLDGALFDYTKLGLSHETAMANLVVYYSMIHERWPGIRLNLLFNLPNWGWKGMPAYRTDIPGNAMYMGDAYAVYGMLIDGLKSAGVPLAGIVVDNPFDYAMGIREMSGSEATGADLVGTDWMGRILELEGMVHEDGLGFSLIFNSQRGGETGGSLYTYDTVGFIDRYYQRGGKPDVCIMESWYRNPTEWLPESDTTTMAGCVKAAMEAVLENVGR
jgi:hypothetical protein